MSAEGERRLVALREYMKSHKISAVVITDNDFFSSEEPPAAFARRSWISGFTGSNGTAVVTLDKAVMETDSRYTVQVKKQLFPGWTQCDSAVAFIASNLKEGEVVSLNKWCISQAFFQNLSNSGFKGSIKLSETDPVDAVWTNRPPMPEMSAYMLDNCGESPVSKLARVGAAMLREDKSSLSVAYCDQVAWLLNLRGKDYDHSPLFVAYAIIQVTPGDSIDEPNVKATMYTDLKCLSLHFAAEGASDEEETSWITQSSPVEALTPLGKHIKEVGWEAKPIGLFARDWKKLANDPKYAESQYPRVSLCPNSNCGVFQTVQDQSRVLKQALVVDLMKAVKNATELEAMRDGHKTDGLALSRFLHWVDQTFTAQEVPTLDEVDLAQKNWFFRKDTCEQQTLYRKKHKAGEIRFTASHLQGYKPLSAPHLSAEEFKYEEASDLVSESFPCLAQVGANSAMPHYSPARPGAAVAKVGEMFLCDSGAQYSRGCTTDVTRTVFLGCDNTGASKASSAARLPSLKQRDGFTRVLLGFLDCCEAVFPPETAGTQLDVLARQHLWAAGLDFGHGTGHGVGAFGLVHETPVMIRQKMGDRQTGRWHQCALQVGHVTSVEPGLYLEGEWGIRIEDLVEVSPCSPPSGLYPASQQISGLMQFKHLTLAPISKALMDLQLFEQRHFNALNSYHQQVWTEISAIAPEGIKDEKERAVFLAWLKDACAPLENPHNASSAPPPSSMYA